MREGTNDVGRPLGGFPDMTYIGQHQWILELAGKKSGVVEDDAEKISQVMRRLGNTVPKLVIGMARRGHRCTTSIY